MKIGTGWLGWTERETNDTSLDVIIDAYRGKIEMIRFTRGDGDPPPPEPTTAAPSGITATTDLFSAIFDR